jgi:bacterioferritin (cytochrome b1)
MLLTREEMTLDFRGARLDPERDRKLLQWIFNQFLYGEVTGIQVGQWLYDAPDLESARFLAKQAIEELQHISNFLNIMQMMGLRPGKPHPVVRFLATGMMADNWAEHVSMEMATGEGFVLAAFYAVIDTLDHAPTVEILKRAVRQEEGHVDFGEQQTIKLIERDPALRRKLLGLSLVWMWGVRRLARFMQTRLPDQDALRRLPDFLALCIACNETRLQRMGVLDRPLAQLSVAYKSALVAEAYARKSGESARKALRLPSFKKRLTDTYLEDPTVQAFMRSAAE